MNRTLTALSGLVLTLLCAGETTAAPPLAERLSAYRVLDASGRIAPRTETTPDASGRIALRPVMSQPPVLLRGRPYFITGFPGAAYAGPNAPRGALNPTGFTRESNPGRTSLFGRLRHGH